ncbi:MAG: hypothetical protein ACEPO8_04625 [Rhodothermaceae bacterium]
MKKLTLFLLFFISVNFLTAQYKNPFYYGENVIGGGLGVTWIDEKPHYAFRLFPEFSLGKVGVGLDINFEVGPDGRLRSENYNEFSDYLSIIRFVRYGKKKDPFYIRVGALDYATIGHGTIMYMYNNSPSFDTRKVGVELDINMDNFGLEMVYGNFAQSGVMGLRGYMKPFADGAIGKIPVIGDMEVGASIVTDVNKYAGVSSGTYDSETDTFSPVTDDGSISIVGIDLGFPVLRSESVNIDLYADYNKIIDFGSGFAAGIEMGFYGLGLVEIKTKFERRINGDNYLPSYFNPLYEIERFKLDKTTGKVTSKVAVLKRTESAGNGYYGELLVRVLGTFDILGSYQRLDDYPESGVLHLYTNILPKSVPFVARAGYDKVNISKDTDIFTLDDRSYLYAEIGYKPLPYMLVSMVYNWTFTPVRDDNENVVGYEPQKKIEPRVSFIYEF